MPTRPPRVFISYSHDSPEHRKRVLALADRLRKDGVDARIDLYEPILAEGWLKWSLQQVKAADFVILVCSERYSRWLRHHDPPSRENLASSWTDMEGALLAQTIYSDGSRVLPVAFSSTDVAQAPQWFFSQKIYDLSLDKNFEALLRRLTQQPVLAPPVFVEKRSQELPDAFTDQVPWAEELLDRLKADHAGVTRFRSVPSDTEEEPDRWLLQIRLRADLRRLYGTAPELLLLAVPGEAHGRDLLQARQELRRSDLDLDPDLLVVTDGEPDLSHRLSYIAPSRGQWIPWSRDRNGFAPLDQQLRVFLPTYDIFEYKDPVRGRQVIGRDRVTADISKRLRQGQAIGVFGLRKIGKTSTVRAATDHLDPVSAHLYGSPSALREQRRDSTDVLAAWLDCQRVFDRSLDSVARQIGRELENRLRLENVPLPSAGGRSPMARLDDLVETALSRFPTKTLCIVLDEYDLLFEDDSGDSAVDGIEKLFGLLRGHAQQSGRLALAVIGRDSSFFDRPKMGGRPNPMLQWVTPHWLGPLGSDDADELLTRLGRRVCLEVGPKTRSIARKWTGGHPLLQRQYGSALLELARPEEQASGHVPTDPLHEDALDAFLDRDAVTTLCREVSDLLLQRYPTSADRFLELSCTSAEKLPRKIAKISAQSAAELRVLRGFGLVLGKTESPWIPEVFRWYFRSVESHDHRFTA